MQKQKYKWNDIIAFRIFNLMHFTRSHLNWLKIWFYFRSFFFVVVECVCLFEVWMNGTTTMKNDCQWHVYYYYYYILNGIKIIMSVQRMANMAPDSNFKCVEMWFGAFAERFVCLPFVVPKCSYVWYIGINGKTVNKVYSTRQSNITAEEIYCSTVYRYVYVM